MQTAERSFILAVDNFAGRDDAVIKALDDFRPRGVAGVTTLSNGQIVLILDMKELLSDLTAQPIAMRAGLRRGRWSSSPKHLIQQVFFRGATAPLFFGAPATIVAGAQLSENWSK
jgi:chemotaxis protein histidine kinase CheA